MNYKKISIVLLVFLTLLVTMSAISAENVNENTDVQSNVDETPVSPEITSNVENTQTTPNSDATKSPTVVKKIKTKVEAPQVASKHKKSNYFKIKVEKRYDDDVPIKHTKLKLKIFTGSKSKTYTVKTNSYGVAKFNTKVLSKGTHKVIISSENEKYEISKQSKIFIGKEYSAILKANSKKVLNKKDTATVKIKNDGDEKEAKVVFVKKPKNTIITKAKFYLKNKFTGKTIVLSDLCEFDDGKWEVPDKDYSYRYTLVKVQVFYIKI